MTSTIHSTQMDEAKLHRVLTTLTPYRLSKYLKVTGHNVREALELYVINTKVSTALMADLHYIEIALRNKFDHELAAKFGRSWFKEPDFLVLVNKYSSNILLKAQKDAEKHWPKNKVLPRGKVIAELTFGFWQQMTESDLEHKLWVPCLHKAFAPRSAPKRAVFNQQLEKLRQLRNRIAHHEPVFHLDLLDLHRRLLEVGRLLCPSTMDLMNQSRSGSEILNS